MSFDTIIIGGGLSGLTAGIALAKAGQRVALAAAGPSTLSYFSGSFDLLGYNAEGKAVSRPLDEIAHLPSSHPYAKIGADNVAQLAAEAHSLLAEAGLSLKGDGVNNHFRITPMGVARPAWLSLDDCLTWEAPQPPEPPNPLKGREVSSLSRRRVSQVPSSKSQISNIKFQISNLSRRRVCQILNIEGFLDFPVEFVAHGLRQMGAQVATQTVALNILQTNRKSPYETRATSIARLMDNDEILRDFAAEIKSKVSSLSRRRVSQVPSSKFQGEPEACQGAGGVSVNGQWSMVNGQWSIVLPAVFGLNGSEPLQKLRSMMGVPVFVIATLPPSLLGMRVQNVLRKRFVELGGNIFHETRVTSGIISGGEVTSIASGYSETVTADHYILATGSFQSHGLVADYREVREPLFSLDIDAAPSRTGWTRPAIFEPQPYMGFGVSTDSHLHPLKGATAVRNLYAVGSVLSGHNALTQADGTGVSLITALAAAEHIKNSTRR